MTRILIVDGPSMVREGLVALLSLSEGYDVLPAAATLAAAEQRLRTEPVDVVVFHDGQQDSTATEALRALRAVNADVPVVVLVTRSDSGPISSLLSMGADACLAVDDPAEALGAAIRAVTTGRSYLSGTATQRVVEELRARTPPPSEAPKLTRRQIQVLELLATGMRSREIAEALGISEKTVDVHRGQLRVRLGLRSIAELTTYAIDHGFVPRGG